MDSNRTNPQTLPSRSFNNGQVHNCSAGVSIPVEQFFASIGRSTVHRPITRDDNFLNVIHKYKKAHHRYKQSKIRRLGASLAPRVAWAVYRATVNFPASGSYSHVSNARKPSPYVVAGLQSRTKLPQKDTLEMTKIKQIWAKYIRFGSLIPLIAMHMLSLISEREEEQLAVGVVNASFHTFLAFAIDLLPPQILNGLQMIDRELTEALSAVKKRTKTRRQVICGQFRLMSHQIEEYLSGRGFGNFLFLGYLLLDSTHSMFQNDPQLFINGMWMTIQFADAPVYDKQQLFCELAKWCGRFGVSLPEEVLEAIKNHS